MATHASKLERWLGPEQCETISRGMVGWYGPPIAIRGVPGAVYATKGGDFCGPIKGGGFASLADYATERLRRIDRKMREAQRGKLNTGFSSLSDLISEATAGGKLQKWFYSKAGAGTSSSAFFSLWNVGAFPPAGGTPAARPGGAVPTNATVGALPIADPGGSDTLHITTMFSQGSSAPNTLLFYDRLFHAGTVSMTTTSQTITGVPTRYATTTSPGNFAFLEVTTSLGATSANLTITYVDQSGNTAEAAPALAMITNAAQTGNRLPHTPWFIPLNGGDTGLRSCTNIALNQSMGAGVTNFVMGHPLALIPQPVANAMVVMDGINSAFNLTQVLAGACPVFMEWKGVASTTQYNGAVELVSG